MYMVNKFLNMITFNVRSLVNSSRRIDLVNTLKCNFIDIAFIQETHLKRNQKCFLEGYTFIQDVSSVGVGIALKQSYSFLRVNIDGILFPNVFIEMFFMIDGIRKRFIFGSLYIPCNSSPSTISDSLCIIKNYCSIYDGVILGGDLNSRNISWGDNFNNINGNTLLNWLQLFSSDYTRISDTIPSFPNGLSFLDHFLISTDLIDTFNPNFYISSLPTFSDHFPLKLRLEFLNFDFLLRQPRLVTSYKETNWLNFQNDIKHQLEIHYPPFDINLSNSEIDIFVNELSYCINEISNNHSSKFELNNKRIQVSDNIKKLYKLKYSWQRELKTLFKRTLNRIDPNYLLISKQIQLLKIIIKEQVQIEQAKLFSERISKIKPGPRAYKEIYRILGNKKSNFSELSVNGVKLTNNDEKLLHLKNHFSSIYAGSSPIRNLNEINDTINSNLSDLPNYLFNFNQNFSSLNFQNEEKLTSVNSLLSYSKLINNKKSSGLDNVSNYLIKKLPVEAFEYLTIIYNNCINNSYFPTAWKVAKICPIRKKPGNIDIGNIRPISLLSNLGKLFEKVIRDKMDLNLQQQYIPNHQFGFKKGHSTSHALLKFHNDVVNNLREQRCTIAISLDIEKAFDHAYHNGILFKMINIGFDPFMIKLFQSFFTNRQFCLQLQNELSTYGNIYCGVPQGSILAPHLYSIFISDFPHVVSGSTSILYADDSLLYAHGVSPADTLRCVSHHLNVVNDFYKEWGIKINVTKSEALCLRNASGKCKRFVVPESKRLRLFLDGHEIPFVSSLRYLGVHFNKLFKFNTHARIFLRKAYNIKGSFGKLLKSKYLPEETKLLIYKTSIRPVLLYAFPIWFSFSPTVMKDFEILERKVIRLCIDKHFEEVNKRFSDKFIYEISNIIPLASYAFSLMKIFIDKIPYHDNILIKNLIYDQNNLNWLNTIYLSPLGYSQNSVNCSNSLVPNFFVSKTLGTHRG